MEYPPRTIEEVRKPLEEHHGRMTHAVAAPNSMQDCVLNPQKSIALRMATAKSILPDHNDTLCMRAGRLVFLGQMALQAMEAAPDSSVPKVSKTRNFCRESFKNRKLLSRKFQKPETFEAKVPKTGDFRAGSRQGTSTSLASLRSAKSFRPPCRLPAAYVMPQTVSAGAAEFLERMSHVVRSTLEPYMRLVTFVQLERICLKAMP